MKEGIVKIEDNKIVSGLRESMKSLMEGLIYYFKLCIEGVKVLEGEVYVGIEVLKGEFGVYIVLDGSSKLYRVKIRILGLLYLLGLDMMVKGYLIVDVVIIIGI